MVICVKSIRDTTYPGNQDYPGPGGKKLRDQGDQVVLGYYPKDYPAFNNQHAVVLLQDVNDRLYIHIGGDGWETGLHEIIDRKLLAPVKALLFYRFYNNRLGDAPYRDPVIDHRYLGDVVLLDDIDSTGDRILWLYREDRGVHDLGCLDLLWLCAVQDNDDLIEGADPGIDIPGLDAGNHGLADPCAFCKICLFQAKGLAALPQFVRGRDMHAALPMVIEG